MQFVEPKPRTWTREEYYRMADAGLFEGQRVQLIEGEIIEMAPQKNDHAVAVTLVDYALRPIFQAGCTIRIQLPLYLGPMSEPEPDVAVVSGSPRDFKDHPGTALLVVEIADSTLRLDRLRKAPLYAQAGIEDYWIVNLIDRCLEVHRRPLQDASGAFRYDELRTLGPADSVIPVAAPAAMIAVADLLP